MAETIPEFLCFRYKGLKRPDQLIAAHTKEGWSFRKWQNWKRVHVGSEDKSLLKLCGDRLVDKGEFDLKHFGRLSQILLNVQRWRKDRESLSVEPDPLASWDSLNRLLAVAKANPNVIMQKLLRDVKDAKEIPQVGILDVFYWHSLAEFFDQLKHPNLNHLAFSQPWDLEKLNTKVCEAITHLYASVGLKPPKRGLRTSAKNMTAQCYVDLGFPEPSYKVVIKTEPHTSKPNDKQPIIEYDSFGPLSLLKLASVEGHHPSRD